ncbi:MAG TPA: 3-dehydro-L-gulonate 2-dehydrogenase [Vicinamibacterales bacterium]|nr:3-dehydro-L-gulonate 2-dehydrogenase [Vicinamibacterales bacterium]
MRVPFDDLWTTMAAVLIRHGFVEDRARLCARLFAEASRDGVATHGLDRFPRFVQNIRDGVVDVHARPVLVGSTGSMERWDGRRGTGNLNAWHSMDRAIALARGHGIACVALANTNHWMRGGTYGWQAADAGVIGICWTNTMPNLPAWGSEVAQLGNNPLVLAVPRPGGPLVLDMAISQFSYGALESYRRRGEPLPVPGGYDPAGELTRDPAAIEQSRRPLPIGFWKGSGLALMLDAMAAILSGGRATHQIPADPALETALSQVFVAIAVDAAGAASVAARIVADLHASRSAAGERPRYPGQRTLEIREQSLREGVPVDAVVWERVRELGTEH